MSWWYYRSSGRSSRRQQPKLVKTDAGIKAKSKKGKFVANWWASRWLQTLESLIDRRRLGRARNYARKGQVLEIAEENGEISSRVQGTQYTPYEVHIRLKQFSDEEWDTVVEKMSSQAIFVAQLLSGDMPQDIEKVFEDAGFSLFPQEEAEIQTECSCPDKANPCKHLAAVFYLLAEQFDEDPFLLFKMRGRSQEQILEVLGRSGLQASVDLTGGFGLELEEEPLSEDLSQFWKMGTLPESWSVSMESPSVPTPVIRRLGFPNFLGDDLAICLMTVYRSIEDQALDLAFAEEGEKR